MTTKECGDCLGSKDGANIGEEFACFKCNVLTSGMNIFALRRDEIGWWIKRARNNYTWTRVSIQEQHLFEEAYERWLAKLVLR